MTIKLSELEEEIEISKNKLITADKEVQRMIDSMQVWQQEKREIQRKNRHLKE